MPNWLAIILCIAAVAGVAYFIKKRKDDDDDDQEIIVVPILPQEEKMKKFALIVGVNHYATPGMDLAGCVNDANNMKQFLLECCGFEDAGIKMLLDNQATKANILGHLNWLISKGAEGVELFYYHSGHGTQVYDASGDEEDQLDEVLVPHDHDWNAPLLDDYVAAIFKKLPAGAFLSMICDTCHSGSMTKDIVRNIAVPKEMAEKMEGKVLKLRKFGMKKDISKSPQNHILLSGCKDNQTSSETTLGGVRQGLLTYTFIKECRNSAKSWKNIHTAVVNSLSGWSQEPVLSGADNLKDRIVFGRKAGDICGPGSLEKELEEKKIKIGKEGLALIKNFEGLSLKAYLCPARVWTIGYGHTKNVREGMRITEEQADKFLREDVVESERWVSKFVTPILNKNQFDALVSWTFNLGPTNLKTSTLLKKLNSCCWDEVPYQFKRWNRAGGRILKGLVRRRNAEALLWAGKNWKDYDKV